jgi:hypothetical protein
MKPSHLALSVCAALLAAAFANRTSAETGYSGYEMMCNFAYHGDARVRMAKQGARVDCKELLVFINPQAQSQIYNRDNHKWCVMNANVWIDSNQNHYFDKVKTGKTMTRFGHKLTEYYCTTYYRDSSNKPQMIAYQLDFWSAKDFDIPANVEDAYAALLGLPSGYGMPLYVRRIKGDKVITYLNTQDVHPYQVTATDLKRPSNYVYSKDSMEVLVGDFADDIDKAMTTQVPRQ